MGVIMSKKISKFILVFGICFILINVIGYVFNISKFITILINKKDGWESSISYIPTILSFLLTTIFFILIKIKNRN